MQYPGLRRLSRDHLPPLTFREDQERGAESLGEGRVARYDDRAPGFGDREPRARIHNVSVAASADYRRAPEARGDREGLVPKLDHSESATAVILHRETPMGRAHRPSERPDAALSEAQETPSQAFGTQGVRDGVEGEALGDPTEIDGHALLVESRSMVGTQQDRSADALRGLRDLRSTRWHTPLCSTNPEIHERAHAHVERSPSDAPSLLRSGEQSVHLGIDLESAATG